MWMIGLTTHLLKLFLLLCVKTYQLLWSDLSAMTYSPDAHLSYPSFYHQWPKMPCGSEDHSKKYPGALLDFVPGHNGSLIRRQTAGPQNYFSLPVCRCRALPPTGETLFQQQITTDPLLVPQDFVLFDRFPSHDI